MKIIRNFWVFISMFVLGLNNWVVNGEKLVIGFFIMVNDFYLDVIIFLGLWMFIGLFVLGI